MQTAHKTFFSDSRQMSKLADESVHLVVTSPPYPMIEMWDEMFKHQNPEIDKYINTGNGTNAFELMHELLDEVWKELYRVLRPGGFACINIGDATRTLNGNFELYTNHARILTSVQKLGFCALPSILWRKQTNAPNKFMGSGMLPAGAYVTLEHEHVLILRKGGKREFTKESQRQNRRESALFWEERNQWFSDVWLDLKGTRQALGDKETRSRSAAFPFELAYRLINMYSVKGDLVVDPFLGMGTTVLAAMAAGRHSVGYEIDETLAETNNALKQESLPMFDKVIRGRLEAHVEFVRKRLDSGKTLKHQNSHYGFPVMTRQEKELIINQPVSIDTKDSSHILVNYALTPQPEFCSN
ncbi:MAG: site-specific DNA-methyltransferase [Desulfobacterales bacterium]|nr:site-specific DNA-methyltransferase [Desulfobacterales bacterium]